MANNQNNNQATKVIIPCRISFANIWEPKSINGSEEKYSVSCIIPKSDKKTLERIHKAVEAAKQIGISKKWGGKIPANLKLPLRDGDIDRPDDEAYADAMFVNANSKDAPQIVDRKVQPRMAYLAIKRLLDLYSNPINVLSDDGSFLRNETDKAQLQMDIDQLDEAIEKWNKFNEHLG